jgi:hypothetical protein
VIALLLALSVAQAPGNLRGRVVDASTGLPIPQAIVTTSGGMARTDAAGRFALTGLPPGEAVLVIRRVGYAPAEVRVRVVPAAPLEIEVRLASLPEILPAVDARAVIAGASPMSGSEARARGRTLAEALDGWEGVVVQRRTVGGPAAPIVRGSAPHEVLVLVDGVPLNDAWTGVADLSRVSTAEVEAVRLLPGARGATHGSRALAGVLEVRTGFQPGVRGAAWGGAYGAAGVALAAAAPAGAVQLGAQVEWERSPDGYPVSLPASRGGDDSRRENAGADVVRAAARLDGPLALTVRGHHARRGLPGTLTNPSLTGVSRESWITAAMWHGPLVLGVEALASETSDPSPPVGAAFRSTLGGLGIEGTVRSAIVGFDLEGGGRVDRLQGSAVGESRKTAARGHVAVARRLGVSSGLWRLTAVPTARLDVWTQSGSPALSLRIDASGERGPVRLHMGAGSSASHPVLADHLFHEGVGVRPNPALRPERVAWEVEAGARARWRIGFLTGTLGLRGYRGRVEDLVLWAPDFRFVWSPGNFDVRRQGYDVRATADVASARLSLGANYSRADVSYDRAEAPQVIYRPTDVSSASLTWTPPTWRLALAARRIGVRFPNHGGVNPLAATTVWEVTIDRSIPLSGALLDVRLALRDLFDRRLEYVAGQPLAGRTFNLRLEVRNR